MSKHKRCAVLISGRGSNMNALIAAAAADNYPAVICGVISNRPEAAGLEAASVHGIPALAIDHKAYDSREKFDAELHRALEGFGAELVACAGFMRIMTAELINRWQGRMINIHPSLLPLYPGLRTHERALEDGVRIHGCTAHFVTPELDSGPIISQAAVSVCRNDTPDSLAARVLRCEHVIYPQALAMVASEAVRLKDGRPVSTAAESPDDVLYSPSHRDLV